MLNHEDKGAVYIEYDGPADDYGKRSFSMDWWDSSWGKWRGQCFRTDPQPYIEDARRRGLRVNERALRSTI